MWWVGSEYLCTEQHSVHTHPARVGRSPGPGVLLYLTLDLRRRYVERIEVTIHTYFVTVTSTMDSPTQKSPTSLHL